MRVSTSWIHTSAAAGLSRKQAEMLRTHQQIETGRRVLTPADDPIAAANALTTEQARASAEQYARNQGVAQATLAHAESTIGQADELLQEVRELVIAAGNGALGPADRASLAVDLRGKIDTLVALANTRGGDGGFLFSGYQESVLPFADTAGGIAYQGDQGSRALQVGAQRLIEISASGSDLFEGAHAGNGSFVVTPSAGSIGIADAGSVINPASLTGHDYQIVFAVAGGVTTYDVVDTTTSTTLIAGAPYVPGGSMEFGGLRLAVSGAPSNGESLAIAPAPRQSTFRTLEDLASLLEASASGAVSTGEFRTRLTGALAAVDQAHEHLLGARTSIGARLRELDTLGIQSENTVLLHEQELSRLVDLDYAEAASRLAMQQMSLEAAQQSYLRVANLTLFNFL